MQPISTTHRDAYLMHRVPKREAFRPKQARDAPQDTPTGRSTSQDSYQPIVLFVRAKSRHARAPHLMPHAMCMCADC